MFLIFRSGIFLQYLKSFIECEEPENWIISICPITNRQKMRRDVEHEEFWIMVSAVISISDPLKRHSFVVLDKLYQVVRTRKMSLCNIADKNVWEREVIFETLIAGVKSLSFLKIC